MDKYVLFTAPRPEILKAMSPKIGEVYGSCFGKREYSQLPKCLARAKVKWGTWKNGDHSSVKQTHIDLDMTLRMITIIGNISYEFGHKNPSLPL